MQRGAELGGARQEKAESSHHREDGGHDSLTEREDRQRPSLDRLEERVHDGLVGALVQEEEEQVVDLVRMRSVHRAVGGDDPVDVGRRALASAVRERRERLPRNRGDQPPRFVAPERASCDERQHRG